MRLCGIDGMIFDVMLSDKLRDFRWIVDRVVSMTIDGCIYKELLAPVEPLTKNIAKSYRILKD